MTIPRIDILGVGVSAINMAMALRTIDGWIRRRERHYICVTGVHGVLESQWDKTPRRIHNAAGLVTPYGRPLVWLSRLRGYRHVERVYGSDLMLAVCERSLTRGYRHFFYGGAPRVAEQMAQRLQECFPGLQVVGTYTPPLHPRSGGEAREVVECINAARPDIIWVGLRPPQQEQWMAEYIDKLDASVLIGVGDAFDFVTGHKRQAPHWMQHIGLEWLFRQKTEPGHLWRRYVTNNPSMVWLLPCHARGKE